MSNNYKGIDDLLASGRQPTRLKGEEVSAFFARTRARLFGPPPAPEAVPAPPSQGERPPFPVEVFPAKVARFARRVAAAMGCPIDFVGLAILVVGGAAIGAARALRVKGGWLEMPGLYAVAVGRPGTVKTPALRAVMRPIYDEQVRLYEEYRAALKQYRKDLQKYEIAMRRRGGEPEPECPDEPAPLRHVF